tara:strand:+ start:357 stop:704 length:348 start_codon:yes stop_codon:yes gene_type:complete
MPLGCSTSLGRARGKGKATFVKRHKEVINARGYTPFPISDDAGNVPNACALGALSNTYYHNGSGAVPAFNDFVYTKKRAGEQFFLPGGVYKVNDGGSFKAITVGSGRVAGIDNCK